MDLTHNLPFPVLSIYNYTNSFIVHVVKMKNPLIKLQKCNYMKLLVTNTLNHYNLILLASGLKRVHYNCSVYIYSKKTNSAQYLVQILYI